MNKDLTEKIMSVQGLIVPPPRGTAMESFVTLAVVLLFAIYLALRETGSGWLVVGFVLMTLIAILMRAAQSFHLSFFFTLWLVLPVLLPSLAAWPFSKAAPLVVYAAFVLAIPNLRKSVLWMRPGRLDAGILLKVLVLMILSSTALVGWAIFCKPDLSPSRANIPSMPLWILPLAGLAFAVINAAVEEAIFRGIILQALDSALGAGITPVVIQGLVFGWMHYSEVGFPKGALGVAMAFIYGLLLGFLRNHSQGMAAPWLAHTGADMTVFLMVAAY